MPDIPAPEADPRAMLVALGITAGPDVFTLHPLTGGWSGCHLWRVDRTGKPSLVLRAFPGSSSTGPRREAAIHALVRAAGIPAPEVVATGDVPGGAAMVLAMMPGISLTQALIEAPDTDAAWALGATSGELLARIHAIPAASLATAGICAGGPFDPGPWHTWQTASPEVLRVLQPWLSDTSGYGLLHLDFHPENLLVDPGTGAITAVLDWTNARLGPPQADLARTRSIVRLIKMIPDLPAGHGIVDAFAEGLTRAHAHLAGEPGPSMQAACDAWALDAQIADLAPKRGTPGFWVTEPMLATFREARDEAVAEADRIRQER